MKKTTSQTSSGGRGLDEAERILSALGVKVAPADHPIYSEGPSITFLHRRTKPPFERGAAEDSGIGGKNDN